MRVGLAIETDAPGGAETMLLQLARQLLEFGHDVVAFGVRDARTFYQDGDVGWLTARFAELGIERPLLAPRGPFGLGSIPDLAAEIRARRLDVLHSHEFTLAVLGAMASNLVGCRHIITMHGGTYYSDVARRRWAMRGAVSLSRHTVAVSRAFRERMTDGLGLHPETVEIVHNGVAPTVGDGRRVREELGVGLDEILVLAVGSLLPVKGHAVLVRALAEMPSEQRPRVAIAGRGPERDRLQHLIETLGLGNDVRLLGYRSDVPDLLDAADVYAMPSISEGLPMAMIEAMIAGKAILASDVGGMGELIPGPDVGILLDAGDVGALALNLSRLASDRVLRDRMGEAARERALARFSATAMTEHYVRLYGG